MKKYIIALLMTMACCFGASAQRVIVTLGSPCVHTHYIERHVHCVPPPHCRAPRYYYAPVEHHHHHVHADHHHGHAPHRGPEHHRR